MKYTSESFLLSSHTLAWIQTCGRWNIIVPLTPPTPSCTQLALSAYSHSFSPAHLSHPGVHLLCPPGLGCIRTLHIRKETVASSSSVAKYWLTLTNMPLGQHSQDKLTISSPSVHSLSSCNSIVWLLWHRWAAYVVTQKVFRRRALKLLVMRASRICEQLNLQSPYRAACTLCITLVYWKWPISCQNWFCLIPFCGDP